MVVYQGCTSSVSPVSFELEADVELQQRFTRLRIWGFVAITPINVCVGLSLAELASAYPVAGGVYHWAAEIADAEWGASMSFVAAYLNIASYILQVAGISATLGQEVLALVNMINPEIEGEPNQEPRPFLFGG